MKCEVKIGPISIKHGLNELKVEEITLKTDMSLEEIPALGKEVREITQFIIEESRKIREVKP